jgi:hypothetical protein
MTEDGWIPTFRRTALPPSSGLKCTSTLNMEVQQPIKRRNVHGKLIYWQSNAAHVLPTRFGNNGLCSVTSLVLIRSYQQYVRTFDTWAHVYRLCRIVKQQPTFSTPLAPFASTEMFFAAWGLTVTVIAHVQSRWRCCAVIDSHQRHAHSCGKSG